MNDAIFVLSVLLVFGVSVLAYALITDRKTTPAH
jgi:hypothetical protein